MTVEKNMQALISGWSPRGSAGTGDVVHALMVRETATLYGRSAGGYLWAIGEPVLGIVLLTLVFSQISQAPPIGTLYPLFYATGYLPYLFYSSAQGRIMSAASGSKSILNHAGIGILDIVIARTILACLTHMAIWVIVFGGISLLYGMSYDIDAPALAACFAAAAGLAFGIGILNCGLAGHFPSWPRIWGVLNRPLFLISGVFYPFASMPPALQDVLWWNPLVHVVALARAGFYPSYDHGYASPLLLGGIIMSTSLVGLALVLSRRMDKD